MTYVLPFEGVALKRHYLKHCNFYENKYTIFGIQTLWLKKSYRKKKIKSWNLFALVWPLRQQLHAP